MTCLTGLGLRALSLVDSVRKLHIASAGKPLERASNTGEKNGAMKKYYSPQFSRRPSELLVRCTSEPTAVITVEPAGKATFAYRCMQTKLINQYNGK